MSHTQQGVTPYIQGDSMSYPGLVSHTQEGVTSYILSDSKSHQRLA